MYNIIVKLYKKGNAQTRIFRFMSKVRKIYVIDELKKGNRKC